MTLYIEFVIIDNFFITFLLAILSYKVVGTKISYLRSTIASVVGTFVAVFYPFINLHNVVLVMIKLGLGAMLALILYFKKNKLLKSFAVFMICTFMFGGFMFAVGYAVHGNVTNALTLPVTNIPIGLIIAGAFIIYIFAKKILLHSKRIRNAENFVCDVQIKLADKIVKGKAFLDTGNRLYDEKNHFPVVVLNIKAALSLLNQEQLTAITLSKGDSAIKNSYYMNYGTVGTSASQNKLLIIKPDDIRLYIDNREHIIGDVMIGLAFYKFSDAVEYDAILHPQVLQNI